MTSIDNIFNTSSVNEDISGPKENPEDKISNEVKTASVGATHVVYEIIYDRSGSMLNMPTAPEALQNFVNQQREFCKENNITTKFTLTVFDTVAEKVPKFDNIVIVGAMANNFLTYKNYKVGKSLIEEGSSEIIKKIYLLTYICGFFDKLKTFTKLEQKWLG